MASSRVRNPGETPMAAMSRTSSQKTSRSKRGGGTMARRGKRHHGGRGKKR